MRTILAVPLLCALVAVPTEARPARCFTTDDGSYPCDFTATDKDGSFSISAKGRPTFMLNMKGPGRATGMPISGAAT